MDLETRNIEVTGRVIGHVDLGIDESGLGLDVQKALTGTAQLPNLIPEVWAEDIEMKAQPQRWMRQLEGPGILVVNTDLLDAPGDIVHIPKLNDLTPATTPIGETTELDPEAMSDDEITLEPDEYGKAVEITRKLMRRWYRKSMEKVTEALANSLAQGEDVNIITAAIAGASLENFPDETFTTVDDITASDIFIPEQLARASTLLDNANAPGEDRFAVIHTVQKGALLRDEQFIDASKYGDNRVVLRGEIGEYLGIRILATTNIPSAVNSGTVTYYKGLLLAKRSLAYALKANPDYEDDYQILKRTTIAASVMEYDTDVLNDDRLVVMYSA